VRASCELVLHVLHLRRFQPSDAATPARKVLMYDPAHIDRHATYSRCDTMIDGKKLPYNTIGPAPLFEKALLPGAAIDCVLQGLELAVQAST
jgi:hypothetical protein